MSELGTQAASRFPQHEIMAMNELAPRQVNITDAFWSPRLAVNAEQAIFHRWRELERSGSLDNSRLVTGDKIGFREGWFFADSDAYKWLDAAARIYAITPDTKLKTLMDTSIDLFFRAQAPDGYLFTYNHPRRGRRRRGPGAPRDRLAKPRPL